MIPDMARIRSAIVDQAMIWPPRHTLTKVFRWRVFVHAAERIIVLALPR